MERTGFTRVLGVTACAALAAGCGSATDMDRLQGDWINNNVNGCAVGMTFRDARFTLIRACVTTTGNDLEARAGVFAVDGKMLHLTVDKTSCFPDDPAFDVSFAVDAFSLTLGDSQGFVGFARNNAMAGAFSGQFGCFDSTTGAFSPYPYCPIGTPPGQGC